MLVINNHIIETPIIDILKRIQSELTNGKLSTIENKGEYIRVTCPKHKNGLESHPSCSVYVGTGDIPYGTWHCLTCQESGSFETFVANCFEVSKREAMQWLIDNYSSAYVSTLPNLESIVLNPNSVENKKDITIDKFESYHPYMTKRHITDEVIKDFDLKYDPEYKAIVFPVKDKNGNIVFLTRRSVDTKKFYIDKDADKSNLYGLDKAYKENTIYLVESQFNCLSLWGWHKPSLALFGCACTDEQINVLNKLPAKHFIIAFDNDTAGRKGTYRLCKYLSKNKFVDVVLFNDSRDVNDLTQEEFESLKVIDRSEFVRGNYV